MAEKPKNKKPPTPRVPDDVLIEIFLRLPVTSLLIFRSVCKHWLFLIENPNFISLYNNRPVNNDHDNDNPMLIMRSISSENPNPLLSTDKNVLTLLSDDQTLAYKHEVDLEVIDMNLASMILGVYVHLLGPCNGLFCITDTLDVVVFNPATRKCRNLPPSNLVPQGWNHFLKTPFGFFTCVAFGFDHVCSDYKVVRFDKVVEEDFDEDEDSDEDYIDLYIEREANDTRHHSYKVEIFSLGSESWRELELVVPFVVTYGFEQYYLFFNGAFHWLVGDIYEIRFILVFDLNKEAFQQFDLPCNYRRINKCVYLSVLNDSLTLVVHRTNDYDHELDLHDELQIFVMREYGNCKSWRKLYKINPAMEFNKPLSFGKDKELFLQTRDGQLVSLNLDTRAIKEFQVNGDPGYMYAFRYRESLVSLSRH